MKNIINIPFPKIDNQTVEFQILDLKTLFKIKIPHNIEYYHRLQFNFIMIVLEGEGIHRIDFKDYTYKKGTVFFIKKNQVHAFKLNPKLQCYILQFTDDFLNSLIKDCVDNIFDYMKYESTMQLSKSLFEDINLNIQLLNNQLKKSTDKYKESILQSLFQSLLFQLKRQREKANTKIKEQNIYLKFVQEVQSSHNYSKKVSDYAKNFNISTKTLSKKIKNHTGEYTKDYLNKYLIIQIKRYLLDENLTIQEIANKLEFDETTNLIKFFKKYENKSPTEFKKTHGIR